MEIITRLKKAFHALMTPEEDSRVPTDEPYSGDLSVTDTTTDMRTSFDAYQSTYSNVSWVHMAVDILASTLATVPFSAKHKESGEEFPDHLILRMLKAPSPHDVGANFIGLTRIYLELTGNAYWEIVRDEAGLPLHLYAKDSSRMKPIADSKIKVKGYSYTKLDGKCRVFGPHEIIHLKYPDPNNPFLGIGRIEAARRSITLDIQSEKYNQAFFENNSIPQALLVPEEPISPEQLRRVRRLLQQEFQGVSKQHGIGILGANLKLEKIGVSAKDMEFLQQQGFNRDKIGSMFHVPPVYMGNFSEASYANSDAQRKMFWEVNQIPWLDWFLQYVNQILVPMIDPEVVIGVDKSFVIPLVESFKTLTKSLLDLRNAGYITTDEGRKLIGLPALDRPETSVILIPGQFRPLEDAISEEPEAEEPSPELDQPEDEEEEPSEDEEEEDTLFFNALEQSLNQSPDQALRGYTDESEAHRRT
jgi:HK97 family phage portal protein